MDIIIAGALFLIALSMLFGKPLRITIKHDYPETVLVEAKPEAVDETPGELTGVEGVLRNLNEIMNGGN